MSEIAYEPDLPGRLGDSTLMDDSQSPPQVMELEYEFEEPPAGPIVRSAFGDYLFTADLWEEVLRNGYTGLSSKQPLRVTTSDAFNAFFPDAVLPVFVWVVVFGTAGINDFALVGGNEKALAISDRALKTVADLSWNSQC